MSSNKESKFPFTYQILTHKLKVCNDFISKTKYDLSNHLPENKNCALEYFICYKCKNYNGDNEHGSEIHFSTHKSISMGCK